MKFNQTIGASLFKTKHYDKLLNWYWIHNYIYTTVVIIIVQLIMNSTLIVILNHHLLHPGTELNWWEIVTCSYVRKAPQSSLAKKKNVSTLTINTRIKLSLSSFFKYNVTRQQRQLNKNNAMNLVVVIEKRLS